MLVCPDWNLDIQITNWRSYKEKMWCPKSQNNQELSSYTKEISKCWHSCLTTLHPRSWWLKLWWKVCCCFGLFDLASVGFPAPEPSQTMSVSMQEHWKKSDRIWWLGSSDYVIKKYFLFFHKKRKSSWMIAWIRFDMHLAHVWAFFKSGCLWGLDTLGEVRGLHFFCTINVEVWKYMRWGIYASPDKHLWTCVER